MTRRQKTLLQELEDHLRFEGLLAEVSARFVHLPAEQVDAEIQEAQHRVCECLDLDRSSLWEISDPDGRILNLSHFYQTSDNPPIPPGLVAGSLFPWTVQKVLNREIVIVPKMADLPPEADRDRESFSLYACKSTCVIPLIEGEMVIGAISFARMRREGDWPQPLVKRLQLLSEVFANAVVRKRVELASREREARLGLVIESAGAGMWDMEPDTNRIWATLRTRKMFGLPTDGEVTNEHFIKVIYSEDRARVNQHVQQAIRSGEDFLLEYRIVLPDGNIRWIVSRGRGYHKSNGEPERLIGLSFDVTDRKQTELQLNESQSLLAALVNSTSDFIWSVDSERFGLLTFNRGLYEYFLHDIGIHIESGMTPDDLLPTVEYARKWYAFYRRALEEGSFTTDYQVSSGARTLRLNLNVLKRDDVVFGISVFGQDITDRIKMEVCLRESYEEIQRLKDRLEAENIYLRNEIYTKNTFEHIIGQSGPLRQLLRQVEQVAPTDAVVLITGETGSGKELIAQAIHDLSKRKGRLLVKVNCASLPASLVESELFGREKGAYTGALTKQIGRFELADRSTLFLDEICELPPEVQAKLLRVLQNGEFERLGGPKTIRADVRLIAATNRDVAAEVRRGAFRQDLYYRLNVFPLHVPPLRERPEDIPLLVDALVREFSKKLDKYIQTVPKRSMEALQRYAWPGNIRELRNVIEHAVIISSGNTLEVMPPKELGDVFPQTNSLEEMEYQHIMGILKRTGWRIKGLRGAAVLLGMKPSTLYMKMKRLGIPTRSDKDSILT